jgi:methionine--tRNA ligase beta chain
MTAEQPISIEQFMAIDLRVATVKSAEPIPKSNKLLKMTVSLGSEERTLVAGIAREYATDELVGRQVVVVANLQPATLMGVTSQGMVLAATEDGTPILLQPDRQVPDGSPVR